MDEQWGQELRRHTLAFAGTSAVLGTAGAAIAHEGVEQALLVMALVMAMAAADCGVRWLAHWGGNKMMQQTAYLIVGIHPETLKAERAEIVTYSSGGPPLSPPNPDPSSPASKYRWAVAYHVCGPNSVDSIRALSTELKNPDWDWVQPLLPAAQRKQGEPK